MKYRKFFIFFILITALVLSGVFYFYNQTFYSSSGKGKNFQIEKGDGIREIAQKLDEEGVINCRFCFVYYMLIKGISGNVLPEKYHISNNLTVPELAVILTSEKEYEIKITFPEGWTNQEMAEELKIQGFSGENFLEIAENPSPEFLKKHELPMAMENLEGYLFPDTYFFFEEEDETEIISKMLNNFGNKVTPEIREEIEKQGKTLEEIIIMASIIEGEVNNDKDRKIVSGIFWDRIKNSQALESCATLAYVLGENKKQYTFEDTRVESSYNTYLNLGLPPGPVNNPGLEAIVAAVYPTFTQYNYFLSDPETGNTVYSKTLEEHNANKDKYGL